jgi:hypothetical protein
MKEQFSKTRSLSIGFSWGSHDDTSETFPGGLKDTHSATYPSASKRRRIVRRITGCARSLGLPIGAIRRLGELFTAGRYPSTPKSPLADGGRLTASAECSERSSSSGRA